MSTKVTKKNVDFSLHLTTKKEIPVTFYGGFLIAKVNLRKDLHDSRDYLMNRKLKITHIYPRKYFENPYKFEWQKYFASVFQLPSRKQHQDKT